MRLYFCQSALSKFCSCAGEHGDVRGFRILEDACLTIYVRTSGKPKFNELEKVSQQMRVNAASKNMRRGHERKRKMKFYTKQLLGNDVLKILESHPALKVLV